MALSYRLSDTTPSSGVLFSGTGALSGRVIVSVVCIILSAAGCTRPVPQGEYTTTRGMMGTFVQVKLKADDIDSKGLKVIAEESIRTAKALEGRLSVFIPDSEVNLLNESGGGKVSPELFRVIERSLEISRVTGGAFDITVSPILKEKGFYRHMPGEVTETIPAGTKGIGWKNVEIDKIKNEVILNNGAWIDLSGIAKGHIVDVMSAYIRSRGVKDFLVNAGGDIFCGGKTKNRDWTVGVREPGTDGIVLRLGLSDISVATSGDYENVIRDAADGQRMAHIIDPHRQQALLEELTSVTVIASSCVDADAFATGIMVMGTERIEEMVEQQGNIGVILLKDGGRKRDILGTAEKFIIRR